MEGHLPPALNVPELGTPACSRALLRQPSPVWHSMGTLQVWCHSWDWCGGQQAGVCSVSGTAWVLPHMAHFLVTHFGLSLSCDSPKKAFSPQPQTHAVVILAAKLPQLCSEQVSRREQGEMAPPPPSSV